MFFSNNEGPEMPRDFTRVKRKLVSALWLGAAAKAASLRYPARKRNKQMTMLTLTNADELSEVYVLVSNKIILKEGVVAWNYSFFKVMRLETELQSVVGKTRYEQSVLNPDHEVRRSFPKEIINLDFTSQDPQEAEGRIENELQSIEETIKIQSGYLTSQKELFVLIYTTLINSHSITCDKIAENSDAKTVRGWPGFNFTGFPNRISEANAKVRIIKHSLCQFSSKYGLIFNLEGETQEQINGNTFVYSVAGIVKRR
jgi:hypothetical protein